MATAIRRLHAGAARGVMRPEVRVNLLGGFEVTCNGVADNLPISSQRLVAFLAIQPRALQRVYVAGMLWPDSSEEHASASLRSALWRLRRPHYGIIAATATHVRLQPFVIVDVAAAAERANRILGGGCIEDGDFEVINPAGEVLPDYYEEWVLLERERFRQLRMHALEALCDQLAAAGRYPAAIRAGLAAVEGEPLRESAQRALIRAHLAEGNPGEALRQYRSFERLLEKELGLCPSDAIRALVPVPVHR